MVRFGMQATISPPRDSRKMQPAFARIYADAVQGWLWRIVFKRSTKQQCYSPKVQGFPVGGGAGKIWRSHDMKLCLAEGAVILCEKTRKWKRVAERLRQGKKFVCEGVCSGLGCLAPTFAGSGYFLAKGSNLEPA